MKRVELKKHSDALGAGAVTADSKAMAKVKVENRFRNIANTHTAVGVAMYTAPRLSVHEGTKFRVEEDAKWVKDKDDRKDWVPLPTEPTERWLLQEHVLGEFLSRSIETGRPLEEQKGRIVRNIACSHLAPGVIATVFNTSMVVAEVQASMPASLVRTVMLKVITTFSESGNVEIVHVTEARCLLSEDMRKKNPDKPCRGTPNCLEIAGSR
jgi:hypothetical protein